jgi:outer membrane biosynthesis protein TonB
MPMDQRDSSDESEGPVWRRYLLLGGGSLLAVAAMVGGIMVLMSGDKNPPRKVNELQVTMITPPPAPPPPPSPPEQQPEQKMVEQTPVKQEMIEERPVDIPKEAPPDAPNDPMDGPPSLEANTAGPGPLRGGKGGLIGGGGGGGGGSGKWGWYASIVQAQIEAALRSNEKTRHAVMRVKVRLWPDATGRVNRVQLMSSTGNSELDAVIRDQILGGMTLREPPPKEMPMPIVMQVTARSPG